MIGIFNLLDEYWLDVNIMGLGTNLSYCRRPSYGYTKMARCLDLTVSLHEDEEARECGQPREAGKGKETGLSLRDERSPANLDFSQRSYLF